MMSSQDRSLPRFFSSSQDPPAPAEVPDSASDSSDVEPTQFRRLSARLLLEKSRGKSIMEAGSSYTINSNSVAGCSNYIPRTPSPHILRISGLEDGSTEINPGIPDIETNGQNHSLADAQTSNLVGPQLANMEVVDETMQNPESRFSSVRPEAPVDVSEGFQEDFVYAVEDGYWEEDVMVVLSPGNAADKGKRDKGKRGSEGKGVVEIQTVDANDTDASSSCSICMEPWTSGGNHRISCLPCGHLFGRSCIRKWIRQSGRNIGKCPQCNKMSKLKDIRTLYVSRIAVVDGEMLQELTSLRAENEKLMLENKNLKDEKRQRKEGRTHQMEIEHLKLQKQKLLQEIRTLCGQKALLAAAMPEQFGSPSGFPKQFVSEECGKYNMQSRLPYGSFERRHTNPSNEFIHPANQGSLVSARSPFGDNRGAECQFKLQGKGNPSATDAVMDNVKHSQHLVLISDSFMDACSVLSSSGTTSLTANSNMVESEVASAAMHSVSVQLPAASVRSSSGQTVNGMMVGHQLTSNRVFPPATEKTEVPSSVSLTLGLGAGNSAAGNLQLPSITAIQQPTSTQEKYSKVWEGLLRGSRQGKTVPICRLVGYRNIRSSETIAADWPSSMQIIRLISLDHITSQHYQGKADFLIFRPLNSHGFLMKLAEKKLSAVIQLPTQTLLLSTSDKSGRMIGMLFPGDNVVFKPQLPSQPHLQQQQPQGMPSAIGQAFSQGQLPNQTRPQFMSQGQFQGQGPASMPGAGYLT